MTEVILNNECVHCDVDRECHDGEHFCRYAMEENSFYKNPKLYRGIEFIPPPTYEELEEENEQLKAQIEKMKKCAICKYAGGCGICLNNEKCHNKDKFELVE